MGNVKSILSMLEDQREYTNHNEVNIYLMDDGKIEIFCVHPKYNDSKDFISLEIFCQFNAFSDFVQAFLVRRILDMDKITPELLLGRYDEEKHLQIIEIYCIIDDLTFGGTLRFRKNSNGLFAIDDSTEKCHRVVEFIAEPEDYIRYTSRYFLTNPNENGSGKTVRSN